MPSFLVAPCIDCDFLLNLKLSASLKKSLCAFSDFLQIYTLKVEHVKSGGGGGWNFFL